MADTERTEVLNELPRLKSFDGPNNSGERVWFRGIRNALVYIEPNTCGGRLCVLLDTGGALFLDTADWVYLDADIAPFAG